MMLSKNNSVTKIKLERKMLRNCYVNKKQASKKPIFRAQLQNGAYGGTRTHTVLLPPDFESGASTNSATQANYKNIISYFC